MTTDSNATALEETPHATTTSEALRRRAQSVIYDTSIDPQWRTIIRYALEINDPWLGDLVRRVDAGETIIDSIDFSLDPKLNTGDSTEATIEALSEIICRAGAEPTAALFVLMGKLEHSPHPKQLANTAKHFAFTRCAESNLYGIVDAQLSLVEAGLLSRNTVTP